MGTFRHAKASRESRGEAGARAQGVQGSRVDNDGQGEPRGAEEARGCRGAGWTKTARGGQEGQRRPGGQGWANGQDGEGARGS